MDKKSRMNHPAPIRHPSLELQDLLNAVMYLEMKAYLMGSSDVMVGLRFVQELIRMAQMEENVTLQSKKKRQAFKPLQALYKKIEKRFIKKTKP